MRTIRIARSLVTFTFVISTVMAAAACTDDRPAVADQAQATGAAQVEPTGPDHVMVNPAELKWADAPSLPPGAKVSLIEGQLDQPVPFTLRVQFPAGYQLAAHRHPAIEHTTVLSGVVNMGMGDTLDKARTTAMPAGSITIMQAGTNHFLWTADGATVQVHGVGPFGITYVNPADDPRTT
jgi:quercetin dioxygenase-like cupin family protein